MKNQKIKSNSKKGENRKRRHKADRKNNEDLSSTT